MRHWCIKNEQSWSWQLYCVLAYSARRDGWWLSLSDSGDLSLERRATRVEYVSPDVHSLDHTYIYKGVSRYYTAYMSISYNSWSEHLIIEALPFLILQGLTYMIIAGRLHISARILWLLTPVFIFIWQFTLFNDAFFSRDLQRFLATCVKLIYLHSVAQSLRDGSLSVSHVKFLSMYLISSLIYLLNCLSVIYLFILGYHMYYKVFYFCRLLKFSSSGFKLYKMYCSSICIGIIHSCMKIKFPSWTIFRMTIKHYHRHCVILNIYWLP